jgi:hypothetical protein
MLTLDEIRTLPAEEIINRMKIESKIPYEKETGPTRKEKILELKPLLKGFFKPDPSLLRREQVIHVGNYFLTVASILPSSDRVFFTFPNETKEFSFSRSYVLGIEQQVFPYKKDDKVTFDESEWTVLTVNPASNMIRITDGVIKRAVSANRVKHDG